jgi:exportin-1
MKSIGFKMQSQFLMRLYQLVESNTLQAPIFDPASVPDPTMTNQVFLREFSASLLKNAFPHLPP